MGEEKRLDTNGTRAAIADFFVSKPLYVETMISTEAGLGQFMPEVLRRGCDGCGDPTNWQLDEEKGRAAGASFRTYACMQCPPGARATITYWYTFLQTTLKRPAADGEKPTVIYATEIRLRKLGQSEPWSIRPDRQLEKELTDEDKRLYRRALMNMSTGYGLGALAYFRRIIENETERMLDLIGELAEADGAVDYLEKLAASKKGFNATQRLELVADVTPRFLRPGGVNPLKRLYAFTSEGLHAKTEEECIEEAIEIRTIFEFVFKYVRDTVKQRREFAAALTKKRGDEEDAS